MTRIVTVLALMAGVAGTPVLAQGSTNAAFDVAIRGLNAGTLTVKGTESGGRYSTAGVLQSRGLVRFLSQFKYTASASGRVNGARFRPNRYDEDADTGSRQSRTRMTYSGGVPTVLEGNTGEVSPASQGGTVDPQTAIYAAFRDVGEKDVCKLNVVMFDGKRRSRVRLGNPRAEGDMIRCDGEYRRLEGFSAKDMAEKTRFPFNMFYAKTAEGRYHVEKVITQTLYGNATLTRR